MIQVYKPSNTEYEKNGDMTLFPEIAEVHAILNGSWEATLKCPIDKEGRWKYLTDEAVIKMPSFNGDQLFRIKEKEKGEEGILCTMEPIFFDSLDDCFLVDIRPTLKSGQEALDIMMAPNKKYKGISNISKKSTAYYEMKNLLSAINGDDENSFLKRWGGEVLYDNYTVYINDKAGSDNGVEVRYGKNIQENGVKETVDMRNVVTRIYPKAYNGYTMTDADYVDSPLIGRYATIKTKTLTFDNVKMKEDEQEGDISNGIIICTTQAELNVALKKRCEEEYEAGIDKPEVSLEIDMVMLQNTEEYKNYYLLEKVSLGDVTHCIHSELEIETQARVIEIRYDSTSEKVTGVILGDYKYDYFGSLTDSTDRINRVITPEGSLIAEKVKGVLNAIDISIRAQSSIAKKAGERAILFEDLDPDSPTYGASCFGTQGFQIANTKDKDGNWIWKTAATAAGIVASCLITGLIADRTGRSYWDLDGGGMSMVGSFLSDNLVGDVAKIEDGKIILLRNGKKTAEVINSVNAGRIIPTINLYDDSGEIVFQVSKDYLKTRAVTAETLSLKIPDSGNPGMSRSVKVDESAGAKKWLYVE